MPHHKGLQGTHFEAHQHLYMKSMVETFDVKKASNIPVSLEVSTLSKADEPQTPGDKEEVLTVPYPAAVRAGRSYGRLL